MADGEGVTEVREVDAPAPEGPTLSDVLGNGRGQQAVVEGDDAYNQPQAEPEAPPLQPGQDRGDGRDVQGRFAPQEVEGEESGEVADPQAGQPEDEPGESPELEEGQEPLEDVDEELLVAIRGEDGEELEVVFDDPELAARVREVQERAAEAEELRAEVQDVRARAQQVRAAQQELNEIQAELNEDPVAFLRESVRPELRQELAIDLLLDDEVYSHALEQIREWEDNPTNRRLTAAERRAQLAERRAEAQKRRDVRKAVQSRSERIVGTLQSFIPPEMGRNDARYFFNDMMRDVQEYISASGAQDISDRELEQLVARRFNQYGVDGTRYNTERDEDGTLVAEPRDEQGQRLAKARRAGARLRQSRQRRQAAGASTPTGVGSPGNRPGPPKGASLGEALEWTRNRLR